MEVVVSEVVSEVEVVVSEAELVEVVAEEVVSEVELVVVAEEVVADGGRRGEEEKRFEEFGRLGDMSAWGRGKM
ncbi:hypothetical protein Hdeb2414_s0003g00106231 [Helianthus debilis subsp. tardiflorus]